MNRELKFSVVVPVYNMADTIGDSIRSILSQTYQNFEIIVQDNNSTDDTEEVVRAFLDSRIKFFKNKTNLGAARNYFEGWKNCHGDILFYLAADDIMAKDALMETRDAFSINEDIGAVTRPYFWFYDDINVPVRITPILNEKKNEVVTINNFGKASIAIHNEVLGQVSGLAFRLKFLQESFFDPDDEWIAHGHPFLNIFKNHPVVMLKNPTIAVRIGSSGLRVKNSIGYIISPTKRWIDMLEKTLFEKKCQKFKDYYIKNVIATNFIGLIQIKNYAPFRYLIREIWYLLKYKWTNIFDPKFWFFTLGCLIIPRAVLIRMVDWYKNKIISRKLKEIKFEYDLNYNQ